MAGREDRICKANGNLNGGKTDDGGHLIASQFGGSGDLDNLVAMSSNINRAGGKWYNMEKEWANAVKNDGATVEVIYNLIMKAIRNDRHILLLIIK